MVDFSWAKTKGALITSSSLFLLTLFKRNNMRYLTEAKSLFWFCYSTRRNSLRGFFWRPEYFPLFPVSPKQSITSALAANKEQSYVSAFSFPLCPDIYLHPEVNIFCNNIILFPIPRVSTDAVAETVRLLRYFLSYSAIDKKYLVLFFLFKNRNPGLLQINFWILSYFKKSLVQACRDLSSPHYILGHEEDLLQFYRNAFSLQRRFWVY